jgi:hypothetical protein
MQPLSHTEDRLLALVKEVHQSAPAAICKHYLQPLYVAAFSILKDGQACRAIIRKIFFNHWNNRHYLSTGMGVAFTVTGNTIRVLQNPIH